MTLGQLGAHLNTNLNDADLGIAPSLRSLPGSDAWSLCRVRRSTLLVVMITENLLRLGFLFALLFLTLCADGL